MHLHFFRSGAFHLLYSFFFFLLLSQLNLHSHMLPFSPRVATMFVSLVSIVDIYMYI